MSFRPSPNKFESSISCSECIQHKIKVHLKIELTNSFDQVGGYNTLRSVWAKLRDGRRVKGKKRSAEDHDSFSNIYENSPKKTKVSLNVSSACERLESILLQDGEAGNRVSKARH